MRPLRTIAVNSSWRLAPWADVLYAADVCWWRHEKPAFSGLRVSCSPHAAEAKLGIRVAPLRWANFQERTPYDRFVLDDTGEIGHGGNSGFQAVNLALQFGCRQVLLLGFDMRPGYRGRLHYHGQHPPGLRNPTPGLLGQWAQTFNRQAPELERCGVLLLIATYGSSLTAFPVQSAKETVARWLTSPLQVA